MKIFDCFTFFNELELLDLRLKVLYEYVDYFVLVEANESHTGITKEFIFEQNKRLFTKYLDKIIYIKVEDPPKYSIKNIWGPENHQRLCIERGLLLAELGDKILVSDVDEIPNPKVFIQHLSTTDPVIFEQRLYYYYINCLQKQIWTGAYMATYGYYDSLQKLREDALTILACNAVSNGGWHYSYMGGAEKIKLKVESIAESHVIINKVGKVDDIKRKMETQKDLWGRTDQNSEKQIVDITVEGMAPKCINEFIKKYPNFYYGDIN